jgi:predicted transcriptional regulator
MGQKRFKDQILGKILQVCGGGANKTQIVYSSNLNFTTVVPYLDLLIKNGLVEIIGGETTRYRTTSKGTKALRYFLEIEKLIPEMVVQEVPA